MASTPLAASEWANFISQWGARDASVSESAAAALLEQQRVSDRAEAAANAATIAALQPRHASPSQARLSESAVRARASDETAAAAAVANEVHVSVSSRLSRNKFFIAAGQSAPSLLRGVPSASSNDGAAPDLWRDSDRDAVQLAQRPESLSSPLPLSRDLQAPSAQAILNARVSEAGAMGITAQLRASGELRMPPLATAAPVPSPAQLVKLSPPAPPLTTRAGVSASPTFPLGGSRQTHVDRNTVLVGGRPLPFFLTDYRGVPPSVLVGDEFLEDVPRPDGKLENDAPSRPLPLLAHRLRRMATIRAKSAKLAEKQSAAPQIVRPEVAAQLPTRSPASVVSEADTRNILVVANERGRAFSAEDGSSEDGSLPEALSSLNPKGNQALELLSDLMSDYSGRRTQPSPRAARAAAESLIVQPTSQPSAQSPQQFIPPTPTRSPNIKVTALRPSSQTRAGRISAVALVRGSSMGAPRTLGTPQTPGPVNALDGPSETSAVNIHNVAPEDTSVQTILSLVAQERAAAASAADAQRRAVFVAHSAYREYTLRTGASQARVMPPPPPTFGRKCLKGGSKEGENGADSAVAGFVPRNNATFELLREVVSSYVKETSPRSLHFNESYTDESESHSAKTSPPAEDVAAPIPAATRRPVLPAPRPFPLQSPRPLPPAPETMQTLVSAVSQPATQLLSTKSSYLSLHKRGSSRSGSAISAMQRSFGDGAGLANFSSGTTRLTSAMPLRTTIEAAATPADFPPLTSAVRGVSSFLDRSQRARASAVAPPRRPASSSTTATVSSFALATDARGRAAALRACAVERGRVPARHGAHSYARGRAPKISTAQGRSDPSNFHPSSPRSKSRSRSRSAATSLATRRKSVCTHDNSAELQQTSDIPFALALGEAMWEHGLRHAGAFVSPRRSADGATLSAAARRTPQRPSQQPEQQSNSNTFRQLDGGVWSPSPRRTASSERSRAEGDTIRLEVSATASSAILQSVKTAPLIMTAGAVARSPEGVTVVSAARATAVVAALAAREAEVAATIAVGVEDELRHAFPHTTAGATQRVPEERGDGVVAAPSTRALGESAVAAQQLMWTREDGDEFDVAPVATTVSLTSRPLPRMSPPAARE